jgi:outer membrane translocation and assembly module TamA
VCSLLRHAVHVRRFQKFRRAFDESHKVVPMVVTEHKDNIPPSRLFVSGGQKRLPGCTKKGQSSRTATG